ncbi:MAG TPA: ABC transporter permease subunit [Thermomicrobiales bacterium]|jgi:ABC-2 type transport system permease protein|nr:ABC transporter permease subunit [Thermomicrobiales bacterium]
MTGLLLLGRALRQGFYGTLALLLGLFVFELIVPPVARDVGTEQLDPVLESLPPAIQAITRSSPDLIVGQGIQGYLTVGFTSPVFLLMICAGVIAFTSGLAAEMERGSIQLALSRSVSRLTVYGARVVGAIVLAAAFAATGPLGILVGLGLIDTDEPIDRMALLPTAAGIFALLLAVSGVTLCLSALGRASGQVVGWSISWLVASYFIDYFATLWSALQPFTPLSVFNYFDPTATLVRAEWSSDNLLVLGAIGVVGFVAGGIVFRLRDLPG